MFPLLVNCSLFCRVTKELCSVGVTSSPCSTNMRVEIWDAPSSNRCAAFSTWVGHGVFQQPLIENFNGRVCTGELYLPCKES